MPGKGWLPNAAEKTPGSKAVSEKEADIRRNQVRQLFQELPPEERTEDGILLFYSRLYREHRELLPSTKHGDPYQSLMVDLSGLYKRS